MKLDFLIENTDNKEGLTKKTTLELTKDQLNEIVSDFDKINTQLT